LSRAKREGDKRGERKNMEGEGFLSR